MGWGGTPEAACAGESLVTNSGAGIPAAARRRVGGPTPGPTSRRANSRCVPPGRGGRGRGRRAGRSGPATAGQSETHCWAHRTGTGALAPRLPTPGRPPGPISGAEALRCGGSRCCLGVGLPRFLVPRPRLGEDTRGAREWRGHTDIKGIFGAVSGICQGDGERTDGEILLPVFPALSGLY